MKPVVPPPNSIPWPPVILFGCVAVGLALGWFLPLEPFSAAVSLPIGVACFAAGIGLDVMAMRAMRRNAANILPHRSATALVTEFPFSISRNPIYLGNSLLLAGAGFLFANPWHLVMAAVSALLVTELAIKREEAHLEALFGDAWRRYAAQTPRWLGLRRG
jgi:protein-S-isoprenylcysteine O-methyltransferase Ste14